jgi:uncharacterized membrane protein
MGIRLLDSILVFLTATAVVFSAYAIGYALSSEHPGTAWIAAAVLIALGVLLGWLTTRRIRHYAEQHGRHTGH